MFGDVTETGNSSNSHPSLPIPPMKSRLTLLLSLSVAGSLCHCHTFWTKALLPGARSFELVWSCCSLWDDNECIDRSEFVAHRFYNMSFQTSWLGTMIWAIFETWDFEMILGLRPQMEARWEKLMVQWWQNRSQHWGPESFVQQLRCRQGWQP